MTDYNIYINAASSNGLALDQDAARNQLADLVIADFMGEDVTFPDGCDDADAAATKAGMALANRYIFFMLTPQSKDEYPCAFIVPAKFVAEKGYCPEYSGPLYDALPPEAGESMECHYDIQIDGISVADAALHLQKYGFVWSEKLQAECDGDPATLASIKTALTPAPSSPNPIAAPTPAKP